MKPGEGVVLTATVTGGSVWVATGSAYTNNKLNSVRDRIIDCLDLRDLKWRGIRLTMTTTSQFSDK